MAVTCTVPVALLTRLDRDTAANIAANSPGTRAAVCSSRCRSCRMSSESASAEPTGPHICRRQEAPDRFRGDGSQDRHQSSTISSLVEV
jgi:hypothetical protein